MYRLLLSVTSPLQDLVAPMGPTHKFIDRHALEILTADQRSAEAAWLRRHLREFRTGCDWADADWKCAAHMYDPGTGRGLPGWPSALETLREYWEAAVAYERKGNGRRAAFYLGAAAHVVQDLCVPHHAASTLLYGHKAFEAFSERYRHRFTAFEQGLYDLASTPEGWGVANAEYATGRHSRCLSRTTHQGDTEQAVADLLPRAQRSTAGFVAFFVSRVVAAA